MKENIVFLIISIIGCLVLATFGEAQKRQVLNLKLVIVDSPLSPPMEDQIRLFQEGMSRLSEVNVKARILKIESVPDIVGANGLGDWLYRLYAWTKAYKSSERFAGHTYFLLPPMVNNGVTYSAGQAGAICTTTRNKRKAFGEVSLRVKSSAGLDRQPQSRVVVLHELLHNLGANHISSKTVVVSKDPYKLDFVEVPNVMHPAAQAYATIPNLPILSATRRHLKYCQQGKNVLGKKL